MLYTKILFVTYLFYASFRLYTEPEYWPLIKSVNLIFHEAGHVFLSFFGAFLHSLGGTLFEFGVPLAITIYFLYQRSYYAAGFGAWWSATAFYSISIYAGDARYQALPLLGGDSVSHDWFTMLSTLGWLRYDQFIADVFLAISITAFVAAGWLFWRDMRNQFNAPAV